MLRIHYSAIKGYLKNFVTPMHRNLIWVAWGLLLLTLPITSLPFLENLVGGATVYPAAAIPLLVLVPLWLLPYIFRRGTLPMDTIPLLGFVALTAISSICAHFILISPWKGHTILSRTLRAWLPLGTGVAFYLVVITLVDSKMKLIRTLQLVNIGAIVMMVWALAQGGVILLREGQYPKAMWTVHSFISIRRMMSSKVSGFAYEASWLANQLNVLYFPIWLGVISQAYSVYKRRLGKVPFEVLILLVGFGVLTLAKSRIGIASFIALIGMMMLATIPIKESEFINKIN